jgi:uracil-DNA glycosylase
MATRPAESTSAADYLPERKTLNSLKHAAADCRGCQLYQNATQTVFGSGKSKARLMLVGEQPGDKEDLEGEPFVGPAGQLLRQLIEQAGLDLRQVYLTNAVKHFKWQPRGKRRLHAKPSSREIFACRPWLEAEIAALKPDFIVCLGATAAQSLLGNKFRLTKARGQVQESTFGIPVLATYHPSAVLRAPDDDRQAMREALLDDLKIAVTLMASEQP